MSEPFDVENEPLLQPRSPHARPGPIPDIRLGGVLQERASIVVRDSSSTSNGGSATSSAFCGPQQTTGACERNDSATNSATLPIILGVVIPLGVAFIAMFILHRRHVKRLRKEDAEDAHKSLDFGLAESGPMPRKKKKKGAAPEMSVADTRNMIRKDRGLSMDLGVASPYLLPPGLHNSRESLHSLSRSFQQADDKYGRTDFIPDDGSIRSPSRIRRSPDDSSSYTGSSRPNFDAQSSKTLLRTGTGDSGPDGALVKEAAIAPKPPSKPLPPAKSGLLAPTPADGRESFLSTTSSNGGVAAFRKSNDYLGAFIRGGAAVANDDNKHAAEPIQTTITEVKQEPKVAEAPKVEITPASSPPARLAGPVRPERLERAPESDQHGTAQNHSEPAAVLDAGEPSLPQLNYTDSNGNTGSFMEQDLTMTASHSSPEPVPKDEPAVPRNPIRGDSRLYEFQRSSNENSQYSNVSQQQHDSQQYLRHDSQQYDQHDSQKYAQHNSQQYSHTSQYSSGQHPHDQYQQYENEDDYYDPEDTYSVYDEYDDGYEYDPRRMTMGMRPLPPDDPSENPEQRANRIRSFYKEYFDESGRNPPAAYDMGYYDQGEYYDDQYYGQNQYYPPRGHSSTGGRHRAMSNGAYGPGPRAFSSASGRYAYPPHARPRPRGPPKKRAPAPKALNVMPTPSKLKDDTFLIDQSIDFAPPLRAVMQRSGTPDSGRGGSRPYSPTIRAHVPLASSFDDLAVMPSPHALRKSGTFTALDFAPPKFRANQDSFSDSGSIRSARSGTSMSAHHAIRAGAYRVSRIPKEVVGTHNDFAEALKPKWDMNR